MMHLIRRSSAIVLGIAVSLSATSAYAQDLAIEEIVVTAQKREQSLQDVPISVSVISGAKIEEAGIDNMDDLAVYVPNFSKGESGGGAIIQIRGIGSGSNPAFEQSVVMYMDDIALGRGPLARMPLMDLERVEVLRGPQNVLFGKNSIAGAVSLITAKPTDEFQGNVSLRYEPDYGDTEAIAVLSGPMSETLSGRLAVRYADYGGYYENTWNGNDEEEREETAIRGTLRWDAGNDTEVIFKVEHNKVDGEGESHELIFGYDTLLPGLSGLGLDYTETVAVIQAGYNAAIAPFGLPPVDVGNDVINQDRDRRSAFNAFQELDLNKAQITYNQGFDKFDFTSVTAYIGYEEDRRGGGGLSGIDITSVVTNEDYDQLSQEFRFTSNAGGDFEWIAGAFFQTWELDQTGSTFVDEMNLPVLLGLAVPSAAGLEAVANLKGTLDYHGESTTYAAFGQFTWNVSDVTRITLGGRYTYEDKEARRVNDIINTTTGEFDITQAIFASCAFGIDYNTLGQASQFFPLPDCDNNPPAIGVYDTHDAQGERGENEFTPSLIVEFDINDSHMLYGSASRGYKAGGFDALAVRERNFEYEDEEVTAFEVGLKSTFADGRAQTNVAIFDSDYEDLQVSTFDGIATFFVGNAAKYGATGIEADGRWRVTEGLTLAGSFAYIDAEFEDYDNATCNARESLLTGAVVCSRTGQQASNTPEWSGNLIADYVIPVSGDMDFRATLDVLYEDEYFTEPTKEVGTIQDSYTKLNLRLAVEAENWTFAVLGKNITDEDVLEFSGIVPLSGSELAAPAYYGYMHPPRTVAAQFDYRF